MDLIRAQTGDIPVTYCIGGRRYRGIPGEFNPQTSRRFADANIKETVYTGICRGLEIRVEYSEYLDYPVAEWVGYITNTSNENSPVISDFYGCECEFSGSSPKLYHNNGDNCTREGNETHVTELAAGTALSFHPKGGRSCDGALPFYRVMFEDFGLNLAIGWPGQWQADFKGTESGVYFGAKQQYTNFYLKPGETARTPRITVMAFDGDCERGVNVWRRWYIDHILPRSHGRKLQPIACMSNNGGGEEFTLATEKNQIEAITTFMKRGVRPDVWWIDAGWYPCKDENGVKRWWQTGTWEPDLEKFPNGLGPVGKLCEENGIDLLVWFEPERVKLKYWPEKYPREFVLELQKEGGDHTTGLLYLGNPRCREWLTNHVDNLIKQSHVKIYRQDFNFAPLEWWLQNETEDRRGITENLHIQGYLQYWDDLLLRNPDLWIDSCASGGRRNDLETLRRSVPLHPTDYGYGEHPVKQAFYTNWIMWTPFYRAITASWDDEDGNYNKGKPHAHGFDNYAVHGAVAPAYSYGVGHNTDDGAFEYAKKMEIIRKKAAAYMLNSDFYLFTELRKNSEDYYAIQFHNEDMDEGFLHCVRNTQCEADILTVKPKALSMDKVYRFESPEFSRTLEMTGAELEENGFTFTIPKRSGEIWFYYAKR